MFFTFRGNPAKFREIQFKFYRKLQKTCFVSKHFKTSSTCLPESKSERYRTRSRFVAFQNPNTDAFLHTAENGLRQAARFLVLRVRALFENSWSAVQISIHVNVELTPRYPRKNEDGRGGGVGGRVPGAMENFYIFHMMFTSYEISVNFV